MKLQEFGKQNEKIVVLIHPSLVMWDYFLEVIPHLETTYHLLIPMIPGYDPDSKEDFTSVEQIAEELAEALMKRGISQIDCLYGCSMGGAVATRMLVDHRLKIEHAVMDGGITPYQLP